MVDSRPSFEREKHEPPMTPVIGGSISSLVEPRPRVPLHLNSVLSVASLSVVIASMLITVACSPL